MDCLFNLQIPPSSENVVVLRPQGNLLKPSAKEKYITIHVNLIGKTFITGVASSYDNTYDEARLGNHMKQNEFAYLIGYLNDTVN